MNNQNQLGKKGKDKKMNKIENYIKLKKSIGKREFRYIHNAEQVQRSLEFVRDEISSRL